MEGKREEGRGKKKTIQNPKSKIQNRFHPSSFILAFSSFILAVPTSAAQRKAPNTRPTGPPVMLQLKFKTGDVNQYRMAAQVETKLPGAGMQPGAPEYTVAVDLIEQEKVNRILPNGGGELAVSLLSGQGVMNGQTFTPAKSAKPTLITFDSRGDLISAKDLPAEDASVPVLSNLFGSGALSMHGVFLPANPVRTGDTWTKVVTITGLTGNNHATVQATFVKMGQVGRYKTARIHSVMTAPLHTMISSMYQPTMDRSAAVGTLDGKMIMTYDTDLAVAEGKVVRAAGNGKVVVTIHLDNSSPEPRPSRSPQGRSGAPSSTPQEVPMVMFLQLGTDLIQ